jgi:hypothetical protein
LRNVKETKYSFVDLLLLFLLLDKSPQGRYTLSNNLNLSLAKTRALLNLLISKSFASTSGQSSGRMGTRLTSGGKELAQKIKNFILIDFEDESLQISGSVLPNHKFRLLTFLNINSFESQGIYERDIAVRSGAEGAITVVKKAKTWIFPDDQETIADFIFDDHQKEQSYNVAIVVYADTIGSVYRSIASVAYYHLADEIDGIFSKYFES